jgi:integrase
MSQETYEKLLEHLSGTYRAISVAAYWTGCRQGELRAWKWEHVDMDRRMVLIPDSKSGRPRVVPIADAVWRELLLLGMRRDRDWPGSPWAFTLDGNAPLAKGALRSAWLRACKNAGLPRLRFHAFRHTAISEMRAAGVEEGAAMAITGHKTRAVFDRYGIQPEAKLREAIEKRESRIRTKYGQSEKNEVTKGAVQ